jgi:DNA-binding MarR family transcriptional regulator
MLGQELSARTVLFHQAIADRLGLGPTDHKCLDLALRASSDEPITAGRLAEITGLTTGAITGVLDRLERAGYIRREKDPRDRRQVLVRPRPERLEEIGRLFEPLRRAWDRVAARYTLEELGVVQRYCEDAVKIMKEETERLRAAPGADEVTLPLDGATEGTILLTRGARNLVLTATNDPYLVRARFNGPPPKIRGQAGDVTVDFGDASRKTEGTIALASSIAWRVKVKGGISRVDAALDRLALAELEVAGGAHQLSLELGQPRGTVPVRIGGGLDTVTITRPRGTPARVHIRGGAARLQVEGLELGSVGGEMRWATPDWERSESRFEMDFSGGAHAITIAIA